MNSTSTINSITVDYFLEPHEIVSPSNNTIKPEIDFISMWSPA